MPRWTGVATTLFGRVNKRLVNIHRREKAPPGCPVPGAARKDQQRASECANKDACIGADGLAPGTQERGRGRATKRRLGTLSLSSAASTEVSNLLETWAIRQVPSAQPPVVTAAVQAGSSSVADATTGQLHVSAPVAGTVPTEKHIVLVSKSFQFKRLKVRPRKISAPGTVPRQHCLCRP